MLKNFWYAVEFGAALGVAPRKVRVLGRDLALYRQAGGAVVAVDSVCPHRGGDLSAGVVQNDCLRCPYHGWEFDRGGACVRIPANPATAPIPRRARVTSYPVEERYGLVWVFLGDLPAAERPPIPPFPEFGQPGWRAITGDFTWRAHYSRVIENGLDFAHGPFVHAQSFGSIDQPEVPDYEIQKEEYGAHVSLRLPGQRPRGIWRLGSNAPRPSVPVTLSFYMPNINRIHLHIGKRWQVVIFDSNIPVDDDHTRTLWISLRNFFPGAWADGNARQRTLQIFREDLPVVEGIRPVVGPAELDRGHELFVKSDQMPLAYRRMRKAFLDRGWGVDRSGPEGAPRRAGDDS